MPSETIPHCLLHGPNHCLHFSGTQVDHRYVHTPLETPGLEVLKKRDFQFTGSHSFQGSYQVLIPRRVVVHGVVGVHLLQPRQQTLHQAVAIRELDELEGHLAPDADDDGVRQQTRVLHFLNAHDLLQIVTRTEARQERRRAGV